MANQRISSKNSHPRLQYSLNEPSHQAGEFGNLLQRKYLYMRVANPTVSAKEECPMLKLKKISECYDQKVFTDSGEYFGDVEEAILTQTKVFGWRVRSTKNSLLSKYLGSAKGSHRSPSASQEHGGHNDHLKSSRAKLFSRRGSVIFSTVSILDG